MTIKSLEDLIISIDGIKQRLDMNDVHGADLVEALTEARETINSLGNLIESSHRGLAARVRQLERKARRLDNQLKTIPGLVTRQVAGEKRVRALTTRVDAVEPKVRDPESARASDIDVEV